MAKESLDSLLKNPQVQRAGAVVVKWYGAYLEQAQNGVLLTGMPENITAEAVSEMIVMKLVHTLNVVGVMYEIAPEENIVGLLIAAFLHDLERSRQAFYGSFSDAATGFNHAGEAAKILQAQRKYFEETIEDFGKIILAVEEHSCSIPAHPENIYVRYTRDADKIQILEEVIANVNGDRTVSPGDPLRISEKAYKAFCRRKLMSFSDIDPDNILDRFLFRIAWMYDINELDSKRLLKKRQTFERILQIMQRISPGEEKLGEIQEEVNRWIQNIDS